MFLARSGVKDAGAERRGRRAEQAETDNRKAAQEKAFLQEWS